ncbi:MAG: protease modulator HflK [Verrucomicrobiales bacterium]|nr:protease modulator HflK [Verrucomicrobiales bacterium]
MSDPQIPIPGPEPTGKPTGKDAPVAPATALVEDASSQALSEALSSSFRVVRFLMLALIGVFLLSGSFIVQPNEVAILLRFGKPVGEGAAMLRQPGWYFGWPAPIDEVVRIKVGESQTVRSTCGWHATTPEMEALGLDPPERGFLSPEADGYVLTADGNIIHARATVKYRVGNPLRYQFGFTNVTQTLTNVVNNAVVYAASRMTADSALYRDKAAFRDLVLARVQQQVDELDLGVTLEPSDVETKPPIDVKRAFDEVIAADQERNQAISDARGYRDETTQRALGEARATITLATSQSNRFVQVVQSLGQSFNEMLPEYEKDPWLFRSRLLTARMERVLTNAQEKMFLPDLPSGVSRELRLNLSREPESRQMPARP